MKRYHSRKTVFSMGDCIFHVLRELCSVPNNLSYSSKEILDRLHRTVDSNFKFYGFGIENIRMLIDQGYIAYEIFKGEENLPDIDKCIVATPKAFELVEARKNREMTMKGINASAYLAASAITISSIALFSGFGMNKFWAIIGGLIIAMIATFGFRYLT